MCYYAPLNLSLYQWHCATALHKFMPIHYSKKEEVLGCLVSRWNLQVWTGILEISTQGPHIPLSVIVWTIVISAYFMFSPCVTWRIAIGRRNLQTIWTEYDRKTFRTHTHVHTARLKHKIQGQTYGRPWLTRVSQQIRMFRAKHAWPALPPREPGQEKRHWAVGPFTWTPESLGISVDAKPGRSTSPSLLCSTGWEPPGYPTWFTFQSHHLHSRAKMLGAPVQQGGTSQNLNLLFIHLGARKKFSRRESTWSNKKF